jgi:hypothetical protein
MEEMDEGGRVVVFIQRGTQEVRKQAKWHVTTRISASHCL